jgi:hypothetical protein
MDFNSPVTEIDIHGKKVVHSEIKIRWYWNYVKGRDAAISCTGNVRHEQTNIQSWSCRSSSGFFISFFITLSGVRLSLLVLRPLLAYCISPGWLWWWWTWWNDWQGRPKYSDKTCPSATLSTTNPTWLDPGSRSGSMWGLWWTKRHWGRFSQSTSVSPANHSTNFSIIILTRGRHNRPNSSHSAKWTQSDSTPPTQYQLKKNIQCLNTQCRIKNWSAEIQALGGKRQLKDVCT